LRSSEEDGQAVGVISPIRDNFRKSGKYLPDQRDLSELLSIPFEGRRRDWLIFQSADLPLRTDYDRKHVSAPSASSFSADPAYIDPPQD
jgi:hypothetical protein